MRGDDAEVVVVGAGLAGLTCAAHLVSRGVEVSVLEAAPRIGGRVRTDEVDGHLCDVGFQLLNPAYPAVARLVDVEALRLRPFAAGVAVRGRDGLAVLGDPRRRPGLLLPTLRSGLLRPRELMALVRWVAPALGPVEWLTRGADAPWGRSLDDAGVRGPLRSQVLEPFLAGVLAEDRGATSAQFVRLLLRSFLRGTPAVPADGMRALPAQLAARLERPVECGVRVEGMTRDGDGLTVRTGEGERRAHRVVVATDPVAAHTLGAVLERGEAVMQGLRTWWFSTTDRLGRDQPATAAMLRVDGTRGPVLNTAVVSDAAPSYAPPGRSLVEATTLLSTPADVRRVREELARIWDVPTAAWDLVVRHDVAHALPAQSAPLLLRRPVSLGDGLFVAGDHRDTASIQGAMVSGQRAARAVLAAGRA